MPLQSKPQMMCSQSEKVEAVSANKTAPDGTSPESKRGPNTIGNSTDIPAFDNNKGVIARRYDGYSADYEGHSKRMGASMDITVSKYLTPHIKANTQLLDLAGGDGLATSRVAPHMLSITIMDLSKKMLEAARRLRRNVKNTVESDFDDILPFPDATFDYVTCISALEFAKDLGFTLSEMFRVTKHGGLILITTDRLDRSSKVQMGKSYIHDTNGFFSIRRTTDEVRGMIAALGGKTVRHGVHNAYRLEGQWVKYDYFLIEKP